VGDALAVVEGWFPVAILANMKRDQMIKSKLKGFKLLRPADPRQLTVNAPLSGPLVTQRSEKTTWPR
jgi:hypothetical protein